MNESSAPPNFTTSARPGLFKRGAIFVRLSFSLLRANPRFLVIPMIGGLASCLALAVIFGGTAFLLWDQFDSRIVFMISGIVLAFPATFITVFCNVALAAGINAAMDGKTMSVGESFDAAWSHKRAITTWALVASTFGVIINQILERIPGLGVVVVRLIAGIAWAIATMLAVPVILVEDRGGIDTVKRSGGIMKSMWPEGVIGATGIGLVMAIPILLVLCIGTVVTLISSANDIAFFWLPFAIATVLAVFVLASISSACETIFNLALFRYATNSGPISGFAAEQLAWLGRPKRSFSRS